MPKAVLSDIVWLPVCGFRLISSKRKSHIYVHTKSLPVPWTVFHTHDTRLGHKHGPEPPVQGQRLAWLRGPGAGASFPEEQLSLGVTKTLANCEQCVFVQHVSLSLGRAPSFPPSPPQSCEGQPTRSSRCQVLGPQSLVLRMPVTLRIRRCTISWEDRWG